jgi:magnesium transporter
VLFNIYVVDRERMLVGVLNLRELLMAPPASSLQEVMKSTTYRIGVELDRRAIIAHPGWREVHSLPVVDARGRFLGALRHRTLKRLELELASKQDARAQTVAALGDLFWTGVAGILDAVTMTAALRRG